MLNYKTRDRTFHRAVALEWPVVTYLTVTSLYRRAKSARLQTATFRGLISSDTSFFQGSLTFSLSRFLHSSTIGRRSFGTVRATTRALSTTAVEMADYDRRPNYDRRPRGGRGRFNDRKRRYGGKDSEICSLSCILTCLDDEFDNRQPQRRRYEEPLSVSLRKQIMSIAESVKALYSYYECS
jgi:hypothetical protein